MEKQDRERTLDAEHGDRCLEIAERNHLRIMCFDRALKLSGYTALDNALKDAEKIYEFVTR